MSKEKRPPHAATVQAKGVEHGARVQRNPARDAATSRPPHPAAVVQQRPVRISKTIFQPHLATVVTADCRNKAPQAASSSLIQRAVFPPPFTETPNSLRDWALQVRAQYNIHWPARNFLAVQLRIRMANGDWKLCKMCMRSGKDAVENQPIDYMVQNKGAITALYDSECNVVAQMLDWIAEVEVHLADAMPGNRSALLYSERAVCHSCQGVLTQFNADHGVSFQCWSGLPPGPVVNDFNV